MPMGTMPSTHPQQMHQQQQQQRIPPQMNPQQQQLLYQQQQQHYSPFDLNHDGRVNYKGNCTVKS